MILKTNLSTVAVVQVHLDGKKLAVPHTVGTEFHQS